MKAEDVRSIMPRFTEASRQFYAGKMSVKEYKGISGGYGSYAQRGGEKGMVRLRLAGGRVTKDKLKFIADTIVRYDPSMVHFTTCQSLQIHNLGPETVEAIVDAAMDHDIFTFGSGGDYPRNVTATPLSGVISSSAFDVQPYAETASRYLLDLAFGQKLPRKLKVGFTSTAENGVDATARDMGFVAKENGRFDVYSGGGLGPNPKLGLLVDRDVDPSETLIYVDAMFRLFRKFGDYENRSKARVRYMRDTLGDERYAQEFLALVKENREGGTVPRVNPAPITYGKKGDGSVPRNTKRIKEQKQEGLYYVVYHPFGGDPNPYRLVEIYKAVKDMEDVEVRISPSGGMYIINLTGREADRIAGITADGAKTLFGASVSCVGSKICQIGLRDSRGMLSELIDMEERNGFGDGVLPMVRISGCANSCSAHQLGTVGLRGTSVDGAAGFRVSVGGSHVLGKEKLGEEIGSVKEEDLPAFFETIGNAVLSSGAGTFREWYGGSPSAIREVCGTLLHQERASHKYI